MTEIAMKGVKRGLEAQHVRLFEQEHHRLQNFLKYVRVYSYKVKR